MGTLEIRMFGALRVQRPGRPVSRFPTKRAKDLFSYLLLNRHAMHSRESLAELLWDGSREHNPRHCLNTALWRLNRVLGPTEPGEHPYLRIDSQYIGFNTASDCRLDVAEFENRCLWAEQLGPGSPEQQAMLYHQAVAFYQADLLVDCYEEWCLVERERLQRLYLRTLDHLIDYHAQRNEPLEATDSALRLLATDPLREDVHRKLMRFYLGTHQPTAALRQYQGCEVALRRELGIAPAPETQALLPEIFRSAGLGAGNGPAAVPDTPAKLPADAGAPEEPGALAEAVAQLTQAVAEFDQAQARVQAAASSLERLASRLLDGSPALPDAGSAGLTGNAAEIVRQASRLVHGAASQTALRPLSPVG